MYLALYRKYRPRIFDDVISQEHITTTLKNQLKSGQTFHAYLFTGSRGTGKTTCAKILAKALNCTDLKDGNPCLECDNCKNIENDFSDITEIDAASNSSVENIRDLKEEAFYTPISSKYRIYIIDEVHMLSNSAFNALLKLIEEPPEHVIFIFATTEVHKIPATIISRCQRFEFRRIDINESKKRLLYIAEKEGKKLTEDAAFLISRISDGGMRDALSLLDKCFSVSDDVDENVVNQCAGISGTGYLFRMSDYISAFNSAECIKLFDELVTRSKDTVRLCEELISHFRCLMLLKSGAGNDVLKITSAEAELYGRQCEKFTLEQIMRCISLLSEALTLMGRVRDPSIMLEMYLIKICTPKLDTDQNSILTRIGELEKKLSGASVSFAPSVKEEQLNSDAPEIQKSDIPEEPVKKEIKKASEEYAEMNELPPPPLYEPPAPGERFEAPAPESFFEAPVPEKLNETVKASKQKKPVSKEKETQDNSSGFTELKGWREILAELPVNIRFLMEGTSAYISGGNVKINGVGAEYAEDPDFKETIENEISRATARKVRIISENTEKRPEEAKPVSKVKKFLEFARSQGINIKEK